MASFQHQTHGGKKVKPTTKTKKSKKKGRVHIGSAINSWRELRSAWSLKTNAELANRLLDLAMKRLPSNSASPEASNKKIRFSSSEVRMLIEQEVQVAVKKNETKLQDLIETIHQLDRAVNFESSMQTLQARINVVTKKAEKALAHMTKAQKKSQLPSRRNGSEDETMETTPSHIDKKYGMDKKLYKMAKTTRKALKKMRAHNEAFKAAMADLSETPPPVLFPYGSPGIKQLGLIKKDPKDEEESKIHVQEAEQCEEPTPKRLKAEHLSPRKCSAHEDTKNDTLSYPPLPETTFPSVLSMEMASYNIPQKPDVHLALIRNPPGLSVLWNVDDKDASAPPMDSYIVYMAIERVKGSGVFRKWNSLGELRVLPMPMCVMVDKYKPGRKVCVAVVGKDKFGRYGPYSRIVTAVIPEEAVES